MITKKYKNILLVPFLVIGILSCGENEDLLQFQEADNKITFPDYPAFSASFTTLDQVELDVAVSGSSTSLNVTGEDGDDFGVVNISNGTGSFSRTLANLGNPETETLIFSDGETERLLGLEISNPASILSTTSETVSLDSVFSVVFEAETVNGAIDSYDLFMKIGEETEYSVTPNAEGLGNTTLLKDSLAFDALNANYSINDTIFFRVDFNSGALSASTSGSVVVTELELTELGTFELRTPDYEISSGVTDSLRNAYNFKVFDYIDDETLVTDLDSADVQLQLNDGELDVVTGTGSGTSFVLAEDGFATGTYQAIRDAFAAGTPTNTVSDIESLDDDAVILIQLGNIPQEGSPSADNRRYALIQVIGISKTQGGVSSEVSFDYIAPAQPTLN